MISEYGVYAIICIYIGLMYVVARWGDGLNLQQRPQLRSWVYGLSLAVYCTSWTFFGAVGTAASKGWDFLPIYLGPLLLFTLGWPLVKKIIGMSKANHVTSIADFIASLYGKSRRIAVLVTVIAVAAAIPYIALQLEAITASIDVISFEQNNATVSDLINAFLISVLLAFFSTVFGTRKLDVTEHHRGLMMAIAFESALKLLAFVGVGVFVLWFVYANPAEMLSRGAASEQVANGPNLSINFMAQSMLALLVFMCLPRQFHVTVIESENQQDLGKARLIFIAYLLIFTLFVIPIALAGSDFLIGSGRPDLYVLQLPMHYQQPSLAMLVFLGGLAAASGMVIISTIALSTMISNDLILPLYLHLKKYHLQRKDGLKRMVLWSRRISIFVISLAAFVFYVMAHNNVPLAAMGNLSFLLMVQFAPAMLLGMYWHKSNKQAAFVGMMAGLAAWMVMVFFPQPIAGVNSAQYGILTTMQQLTSATPPLFKLFSYTLATNVAIHVLYALGTHWLNQRQIAKAGFIDHHSKADDLTVGDLKQVVRRLIGINFADQSFTNFAEGLSHEMTDQDQVSTPLIQFTEKLLAGSIGSSSARAVITAMLQSKGLAVDEILNLLDETKQAIRFNRSLTEATLESISQGVSVVDENLRIVAWNKQYIELLNYPENFIHRGMSITTVLQFNAERGLMPNKDVQQEIEKRLVLLRQRRSYQSERAFDHGKYLQIEGHPMPNGGYVTTYNDITQYKRAQQDLIESQKQIQFYTDHSPAMLAYLDQDKHILFVNKAYEQFVGKNKEQLIGSTLNDLFSATELAKREPYLKAAFKGETQSFEMPTIDHSGQEVFILGTYVPDVKNNQSYKSSVNGVFVILQDISTRHKAEVALEQAKTNLENRVAQRTLELSRTNQELENATAVAQQANLSKTKFIADASHDLLQPFNAARLFAAVLNEKSHDLPDDIASTVTNLDQSLRAAENMLSALLDIAKFDAGGVDVVNTDFPLEQLFKQLATQYKPRARKKGLKLTVRLCKHWVSSDEKLLYRVLQNLTSNAIRYTEKGGVLVAARRDFINVEPHIQIWVFDTGVGLTEREQIEIFNEFKRLNKNSIGSRNEDVPDKGLGLGLSIVERILKQLNIPLSIRSIPNQGSSFMLTVPLAKQHHRSTKTGDENWLQHTSAQQQKTVICIDNEPQILNGMQQLLSGWGLEVHGVEGSVQAHALLSQGISPDLLLVDYQLNDEFGTDVVVDLFKQHELDCPVIVITANHTEELKNSVKAAGFHLLLKPLKPIKLRQLFNQLL